MCTAGLKFVEMKTHNQLLCSVLVEINYIKMRSMPHINHMHIESCLGVYFGVPFRGYHVVPRSFWGVGW